MTELEARIKTWVLTAGKLAADLRKDKHKLDISLKQGRDWVTNADLAVDQYLRDQILQHYPTHKILSEELAPDQNPLQSGPLWVIDPIDGTHNYALGFYYSAVSVAFALSGSVQIGAVYDFFHNELFFATKGGGATLNEQAISPSNRTALKDSHILLGQHWPEDPIDEYLQQITATLRTCRDFRRPGAGALDICMVAAGRAEAFFETLNPWDIAAARLIAAEAGCTLGHFGPAGNLPEDLNAKYFLVASSGIFEEISRLIAVSAVNYKG